MTQTQIVRTHSELFVYSWTTGVKPVVLPGIKTANDVLSHALWLERHGYIDEADDLIERFCSHQRT